MTLRKDGDYYVSDRFLRASDFDNNMGQDNNPEWKTVIFDSKSNSYVTPNGSVGFRWGEDGKWNTQQKNGLDGAEIDAELSCLDSKDDVVTIAFPHFTPGEGDLIKRSVPVRKLMIDGTETLVTSVFDMTVAQYGIDRGLGDETAKGYDDASVAYTPAWGEKVTGIKAADLERTGREFAENASKTKVSRWSSWVQRLTTGITMTWVIVQS